MLKNINEIHRKNEYVIHILPAERRRKIVEQNTRIFDKDVLLTQFSSGKHLCPMSRDYRSKLHKF